MTQATTMHLASPLTLPNGTVLRNRIAKAAMSEVLAGTHDGTPTEALVNLYRRWAKSGAGLLLTGNVMVSHDARGELAQVVVEDERHLDMLRTWASAAQSEGAALFMQINHSGRQAPRSVTRDPVAPSAVAMKLGPFFKTPRALEDGEIRAIIRRFAVTARVAKLAGFAGVQIHAAHGYLVSQFLSPLSNMRDDEWGGDPERRMRFLLEIVRAIRAEVGPSFPIAVKLNSADFQRGGFGEEESMNVVRALEKEGIDLLEISGGNYESPAMMHGKKKASTKAREAFFLEYAEKVRALTKLPLLLTGGMRTAATMEKVIASGAVDMVGIGRPLTLEPDLPARLLDGRATAAREVDVRIGVSMLDALLQTMFSQEQLARMGRGLDPDLGISRLRVLFFGIIHGYFYNPFRTMRRPAPALSAPSEST